MLASSSLHLFRTRDSLLLDGPPVLHTIPTLALVSACIARDASVVPRSYYAALPPRSTPPVPRLDAPPPPDTLPKSAQQPDAVRADDVHAARRGQFNTARPPYPHHPHSHPEFVQTHSPVPRPHPAVSTLEAALHDDRDDSDSAPPLAGAYLSQPPTPASATDPASMSAHHHLQYPAYAHDQPGDQPYVSRAPSVSPAYAQDPAADRRVSTSSAGSYEHAYQYGSYTQPRPHYPARATPPMIARGSLTPYEYPIDSAWSGRRPSSEQSPAPSQPGRPYDDSYHHPEDGIPQPLSYPIPLDHQSPMQSLGSSSSNSTGIPASPDLSLQPSGLVAASLPEGATAPSAQNPGQRTYAFVSLAGSTIRKRPRRRYDEIERLYSCSFEDCTKAYGTLNHLNAHVTMQKHGVKRNPSEFKELRKLWRSQKKAEQMSNRPRRRRGVGQDDDDPRGLHRTSSGSYSSPGYGSDPESDDGTPQPVDHYGQVDPMWSQGMVASGSVAPAMGEMARGRYDEGMGHGHHQYDPHGMAGQHLMGSDQGVLDRLPHNATLLQGLPQSHPSQQFSHPMAGYGPNYDYHRGPGPSGGSYDR